jgi:uncharacterized protein (DUF885 family)
MVIFAGLTMQTDAAPPPRLPALIQEYEADADAVRSFYKVPGTARQLDREEKLHREWLRRLDGVEFPKLTQSDQVDYVLLRNYLERELAELAWERQQLAEIQPLVSFNEVIDRLEQARGRGEPVDYPRAASSVVEIGQRAKELKERVEKGKRPPDAKPDGSPAGTNAVAGLPVPAAQALRAARTVDELRGVLKRWFEFYHGYQPDFAWWVKNPYEEAGKLLDEYAKYLKEEVAGQKGKADDPLVGNPIGTAALQEAIRYEFLPYTPAELIAMGASDLAWCETQAKAAAREMGLGEDWQAALAKVKAEFVPPGQQDELVRRIAEEAIAFTKAHRFATVPALCEELWGINMIPPDTLQTIPYAAYSGQKILVAYPRDDMKQEDKLMIMRGNNRYFVRLSTAHELIPGHHLQAFQAARHHQYRRRFNTPFYFEGWALYCELRFWDLGWARTPEERLGMLFWRMTRAARIITTLQFHLGQMKPDEMVNFFVERAGHERLGATSEVRRFIGHAPPLYQAGYLLGGKQLLALHDELVKPGGLTEQQFNDAVLMAGPMPIELLRAELRQLPLKRDSLPAWKFAGH